MSQPCPPALPKRLPLAASGGFTLTELMIVLVLIGILAAVALPAYLEQVRKGRRSDAVSALSSIQQAQERWRANSPTYADQLATLQIDTNSPKGYYALSLSNVDGSGYTATATAVTGKAQAGDTACATMTVSLSSGRLTYLPSSGGCWPE